MPPKRLAYFYSHGQPQGLPVIKPRYQIVSHLMGQIRGAFVPPVTCFCGAVAKPSESDATGGLAFSVYAGMCRRISMAAPLRRRLLLFQNTQPFDSVRRADQVAVLTKVQPKHGCIFGFSVFRQKSEFFRNRKR